MGVFAYANIFFIISIKVCCNEVVYHYYKSVAEGDTFIIYYSFVYPISLILP
jgi:hypothetical protein